MSNVAFVFHTEQATTLPDPSPAAVSQQPGMSPAAAQAAQANTS